MYIFMYYEKCSFRYFVILVLESFKLGLMKLMAAMLNLSYNNWKRKEALVDLHRSILDFVETLISMAAKRLAICLNLFIACKCVVLHGSHCM